MSYYIIPSPQEYIHCLKYKFDEAKKDNNRLECSKQLKYAKEFNTAIKSSRKYHEERTR